ncbi:MAG: divergent polysaccharide deacetylase family protein [Treponema sp.]|jgi:polysaccharide deacetylase 2 family uncharacterized protein YibQ|nr:divergent polysaccharide deacetylase family protein [Treponema sp.]
MKKPARKTLGYTGRLAVLLAGSLIAIALALGIAVCRFMFPARTGESQDAAPEIPAALVFVIDDAGHNLEDLEPFLRFPGPLTIAVLPGLPYSEEAARRIRAAGKEVFLHQPMEALGGEDPGPGAVYTGMEADEIRAVIGRNLDEVWPAAGMNNHQGSKITGDGAIMEIVLELCRERGAVFVDSKTTPDSAAPAAAARMGMVIAERDVFLDNIQTKESIRRYLREGLALADAAGSAVMIGHAHSPDLAAVLEEFYPGLIDKGYSLVTASQFIERRSAVPPVAVPPGGIPPVQLPAEGLTGEPAPEEVPR